MARKKKENGLDLEPSNIPQKNPVGRPSKYSKELAEAICIQIATTHLGLDDICSRNAGFPVPSTIFLWLTKHPEFSEMYEQARVQQCHVMADQIIKVAFDDTRDDLDTENGLRCNTEWISRSRLKVDALKWLLTKLMPRKYGDKIQNETTVNVISHEEALKALM